MRSKFQFAAATALFFGLAGAVSAPAHAGLVGLGDNTVTPVYWFGTSSPPPLVCTTSLPCEVPNYPLFPGDTAGQNSPPPTIPVDFLQGAISGSTISVGDTQIVITNELAGMPFCSTSTSPCTDVFTGFAFTFSSGVDITGVSVDPASAPDFLPNSTAPHTGLQLLSPTDIIVDVTGDAPAAGDKLILDLAFPTTAVPEPSTWALMLLGLAGLGFAGYRRMGAAGGAMRG